MTEQIITNRTYGIEIEAYNIDRHILAQAMNEAGIETVVEGYNHVTRNHWKIVTDASLQGNKTFEIVSPILRGENGLDQIRTVCRVLNEKNAKVNRSCGLHVHHDAHDFKARNFENLFILYRRAEKTIDSFMPISRRGNNNRFCRSIKDHDGTRRLFADRYYKLNLSSFHRHGTVEFRQHSGTVEAEKIINWVILTQKMVEHSRSSKNRVKNIQKDIAWGTLKVTLGFSRQIKKGMTQAENIANFFEARINHFQAA